MYFTARKPVNRATRQPVVKIGRCAFALCLLFIMHRVPVAAETIAVVLSEDSPVYSELAESMRRTLEEQAPSRFTVSTMSATAIANVNADVFKSGFYQLIITVGMHAASASAYLEAQVPILCTLISKTAFERLAQDRPESVASGSFSAIYLEQPLARQLELVRLVLPGKYRLGVVYGPSSSGYEEELERTAKARGLTVESETIVRLEDLGPAVERVMARSDLLFALPDPEVFNRTTVQDILLSTYRSNSPLIAFSSGYVKAGALAALFTTAQQSARQSAETVAQLMSGSRFVLPPPEYPRYWTIEVNQNVARSFGLDIDEEAKLEEQLRLALERDL